MKIKFPRAALRLSGLRVEDYGADPEDREFQSLTKGPDEKTRSQKLEKGRNDGEN